ncbi:Phenylalanine--tRNA ligase beta subunit [Acholeplasma oculi]|uniref:Phenylalanine--tRNA ligase beta subunit n=1 Tax=Acholeplasma oculi TaxID=35623 RepID=A0A061ACZ3_9MOLU|nr:phenylalanine--tRNA ligase subunit beta [Acholeplasma oculi]CDR31284.1 Phenylalanyl-tRNA synthetase beta subunit [Acholeplasma oculi]SKC38635.1 phenylalanyl-tRNA synthetase beta subunit [Acholeplasma oculi]SUT91472.1 Phenylalanine--tRNA ligase beta subunit [Acholeplasma oculi]
MYILENILKKFIDVPNNLFEITNQNMIEVDEYSLLNTSSNLVIGKVISCLDHPNSDHLHVTKVDVGTEILDIVCGASNVALNQYVIVAKVGAILPGDFQIKAAKVRGESSNGMICSLKELGMDEKYIPKAFSDGIFFFDKEMPLGDNPFKYLGLDGKKLLLGMTPNRGDLLSHLGFAYDLASITNQKVNIPKSSFKPVKPHHGMKVSIQSTNCLEYRLAVLDVEVKESPLWLKNALIESDIRPINNVVDITNYVLITYGTPLHAFDFNKVQSKEVLVRQAKPKEEIQTLDEVKRVLSEEDILITDGKNGIALGGVMGGHLSSIDDHTQKIILEAALFDSKTIEKTSRRLGLKSDSSLRYERGVERSRVALGMDKAIELLIELADARLYEGIEVASLEEKQPTWIELSIEKNNSLLGIDLTLKDIVDILKRLNYEVETIDSDKLNVLPPSYRKDILIPADVSEEILRIYGYQQVKLVNLSLSQMGGLSPKQKKMRSLKKELVGLGFNEVINYSLISPEDVLDYPIVGETVSLLMPMSEDRKVLRQSLIPGLIDHLNYTLKRQMENITTFEIGHVFAKDVEKNHLGILMQGNYIDKNYLQHHLPVDFYVLKGVLNKIETLLGVSLKYVKTSDINALHPGIQAKLLLKDQVIGYMGKLHPNIEKAHDVYDAFVAEIDLSMISYEKDTLVFDSISKYPSITRDLSFVISKSHAMQDVLDLIYQTARKLITDVTLFDVYEGPNVEAGKVSVAVSITFNNKEKTLEKTDVEKALKSIRNRLEFTFKAFFRE